MKYCRHSFFYLWGILISLALAVPAYALELKGRLEWVQKVEMRVIDNGVVETVKVTMGQHVKKGDLLLRMDQREQKAALLELKARLARAELALEDAKRELERTEEMFERGLIAEEELKDAQLNKALADAELESTKAAEAVAKVALERTELRAPFDAIIVERNVWQGAVIYKTLQQKPPIAIAPDDQMLARVLVHADVLRRYRAGQKAKVDIYGRVRDAKVYSLGVEAVRIEPAGAVYELDVIFKRESREILRPSETVMVQLP